MALIETLTAVEVLILAVVFVLGGLIVHGIAAVIIYGNPRFARRVGRRLVTVFEPDIQAAGQRVVRGIYTSFAEAVEKSPEDIVGLVDPFLPHVWEYFIHRLDLLKAELVKTAGAGVGSALPAGLGMLESVIPKEFQGLAQGFLGSMTGGGALPTSTSSSAPALTSGNVFKSIK